jgi:hypothetical protein
MSQLPRIQPTALEMTYVATLLMIENDALREELGRPAKQLGRREVSRQEMERARECGPASYIGDDGAVVLRCDL